MARFVYNAQDYDIYIGNDVDKNSFVLNIRERYRQLMTKTIPAEPEQLYNFINRQFPGQRVVVGYEAGPTGFGLFDYLSERQTHCVVIPPSSIRKPANDRVKTNRIDARKLSNMLAEGDFSPVRVPEGLYRELRNIVKVREYYSQLQCKAKQRIKALLLSNSLHVACRDIDQHWSNRFLLYLKTVECTPAVRFRLNQLLDDLSYARQKLFKAVYELRTFCKDAAFVRHHIRNLLSVPGVGIVTAATLLARIGDPQYLLNVRELGAFCGLVSKENSSGDKVKRGAITQSGSSILRHLLVEAAWRAIKMDTELNQFYGRIAARHHVQYAKQKAIVAVAHKLTLRIFRVLVDRREYTVR